MLWPIWSFEIFNSKFIEIAHQFAICIESDMSKKLHETVQMQSKCSLSFLNIKVNARIYLN